MASFTLLEQADEDKLHATRLLGVEEKPFKRLTKRLLAPNSPIQSFPRRVPDPQNESADEDNTTAKGRHEKFLRDLQRLREEVVVDFAAFESSIARMQFLRAANSKERARYAAEKLTIEETAQAVRDHTARLRVQLDAAQRTLAVRKTYDVLADRIASNPALRPRTEQHVSLEKLRAEIEELERESLDHAQAWRDRRDQFGRVVAEAARLRRLVRDEKEEKADDQEDEGDDDGEDEHQGGDENDDDEEDRNLLSAIDHRRYRDRYREPRSGMGTPRPVDNSGALTPRPGTPRPHTAKEVEEGEDRGDDRGEDGGEDPGDMEMGEAEEGEEPEDGEEINHISVAENGGERNKPGGDQMDMS